jgi:hypothetical protein
VETTVHITSNILIHLPSSTLALTIMRVQGTLLALVPLAIATQNIHITLSQKKGTPEASVTAWNEDKSSIIGHSCSTKLYTGSFGANAVSFIVDENGLGNVTIGAQSFIVHENPEISGGISCNRIHSPLESIVTCAITVPASLQVRSLNRRDLPECFSQGPIALEGVLASLETNVTVPETLYSVSDTSRLEFEDLETSNKLDERDPCDFETHNTIRIGDGNPHQNPLNVQLSVRHPRAKICKGNNFTPS